MTSPGSSASLASPASPGPSIAVVGLGKMGRAVDEVATAWGWPVRARIGRGTPITREQLAGAAVAVDFTTPDAAPATIGACLAAGCPVVVGTTGWYASLPAVWAEVERAGGALLWAANFSLGAVALAGAATAAARSLRGAGDVDAYLVETHHRTKRDAPSGTARVLAAGVSESLGRPVPITSVRAGHVPGEHEVVFDAPFEQLRLVHVVRDRRVFAAGALTAAAWLVGRRGVFTLADVVGSGADGVARSAATARRES
jgi:4-hydroxy-tetrahydrodipicolinate reductase